MRNMAYILIRPYVVSSKGSTSKRDLRFSLLRCCLLPSHVTAGLSIWRVDGSGQILIFLLEAWYHLWPRRTLPRPLNVLLFLSPSSSPGWKSSTCTRRLSSSLPFPVSVVGRRFVSSQVRGYWPSFSKVKNFLMFIKYRMIFLRFSCYCLWDFGTSDHFV